MDLVMEVTTIPRSVDGMEEIVLSLTRSIQIGNGLCDGGDYNTEECGWDGGDCIEFNKYPNCKVDDQHSRIGNGYCDGGDYNTEECGWDGGDCPSSAAKRLLAIDYVVYMIIQLGSFLVCLSYA